MLLDTVEAPFVISKMYTIYCYGSYLFLLERLITSYDNQ